MGLGSDAPAPTVDAAETVVDPADDGLETLLCSKDSSVSDETRPTTKKKTIFFVQTTGSGKPRNGTLVVTQRGTGVEDGRPMTVTEEWHFSRVRDATMTWKQRTPNRVAVEFRKVSKAPAPPS